MRILNADGTEAGACGNATRCVAALIAEETGARHRAPSAPSPACCRAEILGPGLVEVDMGPPRLEWGDIPLAARRRHAASEPRASARSRTRPPVPWATRMRRFSSTISRILPIESIGPVLEKNRMFPERANIGFALIESPERIRLRVWERGAGLTLACGSGACAALVNAHRRGLTGRQATVVLDGGELVITWREDDHVLMRGPAVTAFAGIWTELG